MIKGLDILMHLETSDRAIQEKFDTLASSLGKYNKITLLTKAKYIHNVMYEKKGYRRIGKIKEPIFAPIPYDLFLTINPSPKSAIVVGSVIHDDNFQKTLFFVFAYADNTENEYPIGEKLNIIKMKKENEGIKSNLEIIAEMEEIIKKKE